MKRPVLLLAALAAACLLTACSGPAEEPTTLPTEPAATVFRETAVLPSPVRFTESAMRLDNPERGFYVPCLVDGMPEGTEAEEAEGRLIHLRVSLAEFSHSYLLHDGWEGYEPGGWEPLSEDFLNRLNDTMETFRRSGSSVIVRFAYDKFEGISDMEPEMEGILSHIRQLRPFFEANRDILLAVESGFVGQYGEQHSSRIVRPSYSETTRQTIHTLVEALLDAVPAPISVTVRRPTFAAYACGLSLDELLDTQFPPESPYYRVGVFNDGMFGSEDDLDTYQDRDAEIGWLSRQAAHTPYGGETNYDQSTDGFDYTDGNFVCQEMFRTHVTYLNDEWPEETIDGWRRTAYEGPDPVYAGLSTYAYFENHMGYRYVLRSFDMVDGALRFTVENVGAGNMLKEKTTVLVLADDRGGVQELPTGIDVRTWTSRTLTTEAVPCPAGPGTYRVYLQIRDGNGNQVRLANDNPFEEHGNLLGVIQVPER